MEERIKSFGHKGAALLILCAVGYLFFRFALPVLLPFGVAYLLSCLTRPLCTFLWVKTKISKKVWAVALLLLSALLLCLLVRALFVLVGREAGELVESLRGFLQDGESKLWHLSDKFMGALKSARVLTQEYSLNMTQWLTAALQSVATRLASTLGAMMKATPDIAFFLVVTVLSLFYFTCDLDRIKGEVEGRLPEGGVRTLYKWLSILTGAVKRFIRAFLLIFLITFCLLCVGFFLIGTDYPVLFALFCALVDILPLFGVGTVLVPLAVLQFLWGETAKAVGIGVLFFIIYTVRQIAEPKIMGEAAGVHPIMALLFVFVGFRAGGVGGMLAAPVVLNALCAFWEEKKKKTLYPS